MRVKSFNQYYKLNEEEESKPINQKSSATAERITGLFFQMWQTVVPKIKDYKDSLKDLLEISKAEPYKKGEVMYSVIDKITREADQKYSESYSEIRNAAKKLSNVYSLLGKGSEGEETMKEVSKKIYDIILKSQESLKEVSKEAPKIEEEKEEESIEENYAQDINHIQLFEKNLFTHERSDIKSGITLVLSEIDPLKDHSPSESMRAKCKDYVKELKGIQKKLADEMEWANMKRKGRIEEIEKIKSRILEIQKELNEIKNKTLIEVGVDNKISNELNSIGEIINKAVDSINKETVEEIKSESPEGNKKEEKEESKEYKEIEYGGNNLKKSGENRETIREIQKKMNSILPKEKEINADGLYGDKTKDRISEIAKLYRNLAPEMLKGIDGSKMTPEFQKFLNNLEKNREKIKDLFKS